MNVIIICTCIVAVGFIFMLYAIATAEPYPEEWEKIDEEIFKNQLKEYKSKKSKK